MSRIKSCIEFARYAVEKAMTEESVKAEIERDIFYHESRAAVADAIERGIIKRKEERRISKMNAKRWAHRDTMRQRVVEVNALRKQGVPAKKAANMRGLEYQVYYKWMSEFQLFYK